MSLAIRFDLEWRVGDPPVKLDPALIKLLDAIAAQGTLRAAAQTAGLSYRHAWGLVRDWGQRLGAPLTVMTRKRGAVLTAAGERLRQEWHATGSGLRAELDAAAAAAARGLGSNFGAPAPRNLTIAASHSLALTVAQEIAARDFDLIIELHSYGSLVSLQRLRDGACDLAGFHLPTGALGERLMPQYRALLDPARQVLIGVVDRDQGFVRRPGTRFRHLRDLVRGRLRFVNRQPGSGSRLALDALLAQAGIAATAISGYAHEEHTHLAVAALIASDAADVGLADRAAARKFDLAFVPAFVERYYLAVSKARIESDPVQRLCATLRSNAFRKAVAKLAGNDARPAGVVQSVRDWLKARPDHS